MPWPGSSASAATTTVLMAEHDRGFDEDRWQRLPRALRRSQRSAALCWCRASSTRTGQPRPRRRLGRSSLPRRRTSQPRSCSRMRLAKGGAAMFAHPERREAWRLLDDHRRIAISSESRSGTASTTAGRRDGWELDLCERHPGLVPFFGLDFHTRRQLFPMGMLIDVEAPARRRPSVERSARAIAAAPLPSGSTGDRLTQGPGYGSGPICRSVAAIYAPGGASLASLSGPGVRLARIRA